MEIVVPVTFIRREPYTNKVFNVLKTCFLIYLFCVDIWVPWSKVITFALTGLDFLKDTFTAIIFLCKADAKTFDFCFNIRSSVV